jgi:hypothetical protein
MASMLKKVKLQYCMYKNAQNNRGKIKRRDHEFLVRGVRASEIQGSATLALQYNGQTCCLILLIDWIGWKEDFRRKGASVIHS